MHTPLDAHLHTPECNKIIAALLKCHSDTNKLQQLFGSCNDLDTQTRACTKAERIERTTIHRQEAKEKRAAIAKKVAEQSKAGVDWREELKKKINE